MIEIFISCIIMVCATFYIWNSFVEQKFIWKNKKTLILLLLASIVVYVNYIFMTPLLKFLNVTFLLIIVNKFLYSNKLKDSIIYPVITQTLCFLAESIFAIVMFCILEDGVTDFIEQYFGNIITNIIVSSLAILLSKIPLIRKIIIKFNKLVIKIDAVVIIFTSFVIIFTYNIYALNIYYKISSEILMILSVIVSFISFIIVYLFFKTKDDYYKIVDKYNSSLTSLKSFEDVLNDYRINNHENKNQLMTIRNMSNDKKIIKFVDTIIDNRIKDNKTIMSETSIIPSGGLRGLVYSKLLIMDKNGIDYELDVSNSMRIVDLDIYDNDTVLDICKIIGIFLDNAIEEVMNLEEKYIIIEMYNTDNKINVSITNIFDNTKSKENIYKVGFSTKGGNHGYGLSLVKKLVNRNNLLKSYHEITDNEFTQVLEIKSP